MSARASFFLVTVAFTGIITMSGCGSGYSALPSGSQAPEIQAAGWTNGGPPADLEGNVIVLEMFATW